MIKEITERFWWVILPGLPLGIVCSIRALGVLTSNSFYHNEKNLDILKSLGSFASTFGLIIFIVFCYIVGFIVNDISKRIWRSARDCYGTTTFHTKVLDVLGSTEDSKKLRQVKMRELYLVMGILISSVIGIVFEWSYSISDYGQNFILIVLEIIVILSVVFILSKPVFRMIKHNKEAQKEREKHL